MNGENKRTHLNMIQNIVTRMGNNSFSLKEWSVGIMIAIYAFAGKSSNKAVIITLIPLVIFWMLDTYYLCLERKFRMLYDDVRKKEEKDIDYDMNFNNIKLEIGKINELNFFKIMFSKSEIFFYMACIITTFIIYFVSF